MSKNGQKVILIGDGAVGSAFAYASVIQGVGRELGIIDLNEDRVEGDVLDLIDALAYTSPKKIYKATYEDCADADVVVITAGAAQKPGETRLDLVDKNLRIFKSMVDQVMASGFDGIFLVATNPVDVLTYAVWKFSGLPANRVIGSGTSLDSARFRQELATHLDVDARNVHAYIMGEHGDTEFPVWSHANIGGQSIYEWVGKTSKVDEAELVNLFYHVRDKAYKIIEKKGATFYGIGVSLVRILKAILHDENAIIPVSVYLDGEYDQKDVFIGAPAIINRDGIRGVIEADLNDHEFQQMELSATRLRETIETAWAKLDD